MFKITEYRDVDGRRILVKGDYDFGVIQHTFLNSDDEPRYVVQYVRREMGDSKLLSTHSEYIVIGLAPEMFDKHYNKLIGQTHA